MLEGTLQIKSIVIIIIRGHATTAVPIESTRWQQTQSAVSAQPPLMAFTHGAFSVGTFTFIE